METSDNSQICLNILSRPLKSFFLKHKRKSTTGRTDPNRFIFAKMLAFFAKRFVRWNSSPNKQERSDDFDLE